MNKSLPLLLLVVLTACSQQSQNIKERELAVKEKEIELREREIALKEQTKDKQAEDSVKKEEQPIVETKKTEMDLSTLYKKHKESVFLILASDNRKISQGSGFFIREDGIGVSNYHVFENANQAVIHTNDGGSYMITELLNYDKDRDFVVFKISNTSGNKFKPVNFANKVPEIGEECFAIGNPEGLEQTLSKGIVSGYRDNYIQTTAQITYGSSGGALFNKNGEVIGITTKGLSEADLNFALNTVNFDFYNSLNQQNVNVSGYQQKAIAENANDTYQQKTMSVIEDYFAALQYHDYQRLETIFANNLTRFYNYMNFTKQEAIADHANYAKTYPNPQSIIDYNSVKMNKDYDGSILVNFKVDFKIKKESWDNSKNYEFDMYIKLDEDYKINSVFSNIIN